jgi:hypothetical protein
LTSGQHILDPIDNVRSRVGAIDAMLTSAISPGPLTPSG